MATTWHRVILWPILRIKPPANAWRAWHGFAALIEGRAYHIITQGLPASKGWGQGQLPGCGAWWLRDAMSEAKALLMGVDDFYFFCPRLCNYWNWFFWFLVQVVSWNCLINKFVKYSEWSLSARLSSFLRHHLRLNRHHHHHHHHHHHPPHHVYVGRTTLHKNSPKFGSFISWRISLLNITTSWHHLSSQPWGQVKSAQVFTQVPEKKGSTLVAVMVPE